jgi:hypothetical protein
MLKQLKFMRKLKKKKNLVTDTKQLNEIKEIGKKMENAIGEYFYREKLK